MERLRAWWRLGHKCFVAKAGSRVVAAGWIGFHEVLQLPFSVVLKADEAYITGARTAQAWRGKGIHPELEYRRILYAREAGYRTVYVAISADNGRSRRSFRRRDWELSSVVLFFAAVPELTRCRAGVGQLPVGLPVPDDPDRAEAVIDSCASRA